MLLLQITNLFTCVVSVCGTIELLSVEVQGHAMDDHEILSAATDLVGAGKIQEATPLIYDLIERTTDEYVLAESLQLLSRDPKGAIKQWSVLLQHATSSNGDVGEAAMRAMVSADSKAALDKLTEFLNHENADVRWNALFVMEEYGFKSNPALLKVRELLRKDPSESVRWQSAAVILAGSPTAKDAAVHLEPGLDDPTFLVRVYTAEKYIQGRPNDARARYLLLAGVHDSDRYIKAKALSGIGYVEGDAAVEEAIFTVSGLIPDLEIGCGNAAIMALSRLGKSNPQSVVSLLTSDSNKKVGYAASAIKEWGPMGSDFVDDLLRAYRKVTSLPPIESRNPDPDQRYYCRNSLLIALGELARPQDKQLVSVFVDAIENDNELVRAAVATGLSRVGNGEDEKGVLEVLSKLNSDPDETVRKAAKLAIDKLKTN